MSSSTGPPPGGDVNKAGSLIAMYAIELTIAVVLTVARVWCRWRGGEFGKDDIFLVFTVTVFFGLTIMVGLFSSAGGCRHMYYVPESQQLYITKLIFVAQPFVEMACSLSRVSVAFLLLRILGPNRDWKKMFLWFAIPTTMVLTVLTSFFAFFQCENPAAFWTPGLKTKCWDPKVKVNFTYFYDAFNAFLDVAMTGIAWIMIYQLQMPIRRKLGLMALLSIGLLAAVSATVKVSCVSELLNTSDLPWSIYPLWAWAGWEITFSIVCATVPTLRPLWTTLFGKRKTTTYYYDMEDRSGKSGGSKAVSKGSQGSQGSQTGRVPISNKHDSQTRLSEPVVRERPSTQQESDVDTESAHDAI